MRSTYLRLMAAAPIDVHMDEQIKLKTGPDRQCVNFIIFYSTYHLPIIVVLKVYLYEMMSYYYQTRLFCFMHMHHILKLLRGRIINTILVKLFILIEIITRFYCRYQPKLFSSVFTRGTDIDIPK